MPDMGYTAKFPLSFELGDQGHGTDIGCSISYDVSVLTQQRVERFLQHFEVITAAMVGTPDLAIGGSFRDTGIS